MTAATRACSPLALGDNHDAPLLDGCLRAPAHGVARSFALALLLLVATAIVHAQPATVVQVEPNLAAAGSLLRVRFPDMFSSCTRIESWDVVRQAFTLTLTMRYEDLPCGTPAPGEVVLPLGRFGPGRYTLLYQGIEGAAGPLPVQTTGFEVYAAANSIPAMGRNTVLMLAAVFAALGAWAVARRS